MVTNWVDVDGGSIAVHVHGEGPSVVLVHGAGGDGHNWDRLLAGLPGRRCVVVDRAGFGASRWNAAAPPSRADHGQHLAAVVASLAAGPCDAVGTSGGALAVIEALRGDPLLLRRVVLIEPPLGIRAAGTTTLEPSLAPPDTVAADPAELRARGIESVRRLDAAAWDALGGGEQERYVASFAAMFRETRQPPYELSSSQLAAITTPALVIAGSRTTPRLAALSREVAAVLPAATFAEVAGAAHLMYITHPDDVAARIETFLSA
jgi:pimeloyl-ACP methyl ester carboxylesterase